jgi:ribulose-phosphate 3-epimerase
MIKIAPSVLSADFTRLGEHLRQAEAGGADWMHLDIMDGHFVPNISYGPILVEAVNRATKLPLDVHLMIENPDFFVPEFVKAGADWVTVHVETCPHLHRSVQLIKGLGAKAGVSLNPATPASTLVEIIPYVDLILVMSVNPGFGGQSFIESCLPKLQYIAGMAKTKKPDTLISIDGGVGPKQIGALVKAGADVIVAGSAVFGKPDVAKAIKELREAAAKG